MAVDGILDSVKSQEEQYRQLLMRLTGVFAANVHVAQDGTLTEIHILGSSLRNPKQIMRDVQSALVSSYGIQVDHRVISIAQLRQDPAPSSEEHDLSLPSEIRLRSHELSQNVVGDRYSIRITLLKGDVEFVGLYTCKNTPIQRPRAAANAVLQAVHSFLGMDEVFQLLAIQFTQLANVNVAVAMVECLADPTGPVLIGAAECTGDEALAIVRATLDALNRKLALMASNPS